MILYGWHTVTAALANPQRNIRKLLLTENAARRLADENIDTRVAPEIVRPSRDRSAPGPGRRSSRLACGGRSPALARYSTRCHRRHRAGARPDHRSAQCRRHPALRRGIRGEGHRHHSAAQSGSHRRAGEVRVWRTRACAHRQRTKSCARADRHERRRLHDCRSRQRRHGKSERGAIAGSHWRWCSARKAKVCGN